MKFAMQYGAFEIESMPGQPQVAICHSFFVPETLRGRGLAHALKQDQIRVLIDQHYDFAICTVAASNVRQISVLKRAGWSPIVTGFQNSRIGGHTLIFGFDVSAVRDPLTASIPAYEIQDGPASTVRSQ
jgi:hypothetical protein